MEEREVNVIALAPSASSEGDFVLVLREHQGRRQLLITIGAFEAQAIALGLEQWSVAQPQTHDLCLNLLTHAGENLYAVALVGQQEGIFQAQLGLRREGKVSWVAARPSDAIALAVRKPCPIYAREALLAEAGQLAQGSPEDPYPPQEVLAEASLAELQELLARALAEERYEQAEQLQALIDQKQQN